MVTPVHPHVINFHWLLTILRCDPVYSPSPRAQYNSCLNRIARRHDNPTVLTHDLRLIRQLRERNRDHLTFVIRERYPVHFPFGQHVFINAPESIIDIPASSGLEYHVVKELNPLIK